MFVLPSDTTDKMTTDHSLLHLLLRVGSVHVQVHASSAMHILCCMQIQCIFACDKSWAYATSSIQAALHKALQEV